MYNAIQSYQEMSDMLEYKIDEVFPHRAQSATMKALATKYSVLAIHAYKEHKGTPRLRRLVSKYRDTITSTKVEPFMMKQIMEWSATLCSLKS